MSMYEYTKQLEQKVEKIEKDLKELVEALKRIEQEAIKTSALIEACGASTELTNSVLQSGKIIDAARSAVAKIGARL